MGSQEPISTRNSKLNQLFLGKAASVGPRTLATRESLLDALMVLYDECNNEYFMRDKHISSFVNKYKSVINEIHHLRLSIIDFEPKNVIGRGHFGEVQVVKEKSSGDVYAMKILKKSETLSQENIAFFEEERDIMAKAKNPWITSLQYAFQDHKNLYLVMEFHPGGDLLSLLSRYDDIFEESMAKFYLAEMVVGIHSLHQMGYVHRDIKPDNVLIDRTGHIKLADFGSAAKLSATKTVTSQMPVGTPDYVAPEVLTSMNGREKNSGNYGRECDWWSLGVVAYEMLFGKTPFTADSIVMTYSNIMNFKKSLQFSNDITISREAKKLMKELLSEKEERLGYEGLGCHSFFADIDWTAIRQIAPPFVPTVGSVDDTSNFDEFEPEVELPDFDNMRKKREFSGRDLPFVGFTFTKNLGNALSADRQLSVAHDIASPAAKSNLERRLTVKTRELQETQEKFNQLQNQQTSFRNKADHNATALREKTEELKRVRVERDTLERDMALYITEVKNLKRMLELQKKDQVNTDITAVQLLSDIQEKNKKAKELKEELQRGELEEYRQTMAQFEQDRFVSARRAERLESELKSQQKECEEAKSKVTQLQTKIIKMKDNTKCDVVDLQTKLEKMTEESNKQIHEYKQKLEKALQSSRQATQLLQHSRKKMDDMEGELSSLRKQENFKADLEEKLQASESGRRSLMKRMKQVEERDTKLNESMETKHQLTQDLSKQILELEDKYEEMERENKKLKRTVEMTEKELDDKIQEYEHKLKVVSIKKKTVRFNLGDDHHDNDETDTKLTERISEQQNTITMLQANISVLEKQIEGMIETKNRKLNVERKEHERATHEKVADLKQENLYLETQNSNLKCKIKQLEMNQNTCASSVTEMEDRLSQTISHYEGQLSELRSRLQGAVRASNESNDKLSNIEDNEKKLKGKLEKLQGELDTTCSKAELQISKLQDENDTIKDKYETLRESCEVITELEEQLSQLAEQNTELNQQNQELDRQVDKLQDDVGNKEMEIERLEDEVTERKHKCEGHELTISMLKSTCTMLEEQVLDLEALNERLEDRESTWNDTRAALEKEIEDLQIKLKGVQQELSAEKQSRLYAEEKGIELAETLEESNKTHRVESERLQKQLQEHKEQESKLSDNLNDLEKKHSMLELNVKALQRQYNDEKAYSEKLNDQVDKLNTQIISLKTSTFKLTQGLEEAIEKGELLKVEKIDLENELENLQEQFSHQRIKLDGTISQQSKLIDFLQTKVETPAKKKRKFLPHRKNKETAPPPGLPLQYKDLQQNLEREKSRRVQLQEQLNKMKVEMQAAKREIVLAKAKHGDIVAQTPRAKGVESAIMLSPSNQPSASSLMLLAPGTRKTEKAKTDTLSVHRPKERMKHNIPHRFTTGLNMRATKCAVCMDSIHFGRQASKCHECHLVCHAKCSSLLPHTCGLPSQLMEHFSEALTHTASPAVGCDSAEDSMIGLEAWMKVPRPGKQGWEKKWVAVDGSKVCIYDKENSLEPIDEFDLCPADGKVSVHAGVTSAELFNTASTDLPYIIRLELHPKTTCWPGRNMYLMAMSFPDKQKWMVNLESIVTSGNENLTRANAKLLGNCLIVLEDEQYIDINSTLLLDDQILLVGAEEGLYSMLIKKRDHIAPLGGVDSVFQMLTITELGLVVMIAGDTRQLCTVDFKQLKTRASQASVTQSAIDPKLVDNVDSCHLFAVGSANRSVYLCAAMPDKIVLMKYNSIKGTFSVAKELETTEPCSCIHFTHASVLVGTDKFYEIDLQQYTVEEFLDPSDTSLAYAVYGARHVNSFPVSILQISDRSEPLEFLLCFHEFGVFVDEYGRRTRTDDMKWTCLPLAFSYRAPYLYVIHFNSLEVCKIKSDAQPDSTNAHTFMDLVNPRYIGPAITEGAIYIASCHEDMVELLCLQGNTTTSESGNTSKVTAASESKAQSSKRPLTEVCYNQTPVRRSTRFKGSPLETNQSTKRPRYDTDNSTQV